MWQFWSVLLTAMMPVSELRGAIPLAIGAYHWPVWQAYLISVIGNIIPPILILIFLKRLSDFLSKRWKFAERFFSRLFKRTEMKYRKMIEKWGPLALIIFVAIPLPFTGAWTGSLVAFVFDLPFKKSIALIFIGVLIAGVLVTLASLGVFTFFNKII